MATLSIWRTHGCHAFCHAFCLGRSCLERRVSAALVPLVPARKAVEGAVLVEFAEDTELPVQVECGTVMLSVYLSW